MSYWNYFKFGIMRIFGKKPKLDYKIIKVDKKENLNPEKCYYPSCKKKLIGFVYQCPYCNGIFCEKHRLPENHGCKNPQLPREMRIGSVIKYTHERN